MAKFVTRYECFRCSAITKNEKKKKNTIKINNVCS